VWCSIIPTIFPSDIIVAIVCPFPTFTARTVLAFSTTGSFRHPSMAAGDVSISKTLALGSCLLEAKAADFILKKCEGISSSVKARFSGFELSSRSSFIF